MGSNTLRAIESSESCSKAIEGLDAADEVAVYQKWSSMKRTSLVIRILWMARF